MSPHDLRAGLFRTWVRVRNASGETIPPHAVLRITGSTLSDGQRIYTVAKPNSTFYRRYLVNGPAAIGSSSSAEGWATFLNDGGFVMKSGTPSLDEEWGATANQWYLSQNRPGFLVTGGTTTSGGNSVLEARQIIPASVLGKADTAISLNSSGTVRVYGGTPGSESDTGLTIASVYTKSSDLADEDWVNVGWLHGKPYAVKFVC